MEEHIDLICRISLVLILLGAMATGLPHRKKADDRGGRVSRREDPTWFWVCMSFVGPPAFLAIITFIIQPRWLDWSAVSL
ncbi:MAG: hypothetical protein O7G85_05480, partial [Planctomycetota bacterium]|nr:hypothetical protein [Planctomycetota bacterium]